MMFGTEDRSRLLSIARRSLEARVCRARDPEVASGGVLDTRCGAFVSIHLGDALRGCLGRLEADWPVGRVVQHLGRAVADSDPRFAPVVADELVHLSIEISVLTPEQEIDSINEIEIGRHGLIVEASGRRGVLLPQVAREYAWDVETFLRHACLKAALSPDAWATGARVLIFEAEVFGDSRAERLPEIAL